MRKFLATLVLFFMFGSFICAHAETEAIIYVDDFKSVDMVLYHINSYAMPHVELPQKENIPSEYQAGKSRIDKIFKDVFVEGKDFSVIESRENAIDYKESLNPNYLHVYVSITHHLFKNPETKKAYTMASMRVDLMKEGKLISNEGILRQSFAFIATDGYDQYLDNFKDGLTMLVGNIPNMIECAHKSASCKPHFYNRHIVED